MVTAGPQAVLGRFTKAIGTGGKRSYRNKATRARLYFDAAGGRWTLVSAKAAKTATRLSTSSNAGEQVPWDCDETMDGAAWTDEQGVACAPRLQLEGEAVRGGWLDVPDARARSRGTVRSYACTRAHTCSPVDSRGCCGAQFGGRVCELDPPSPTLAAARAGHHRWQ